MQRHRKSVHVQGNGQILSALKEFAAPGGHMFAVIYNSILLYDCAINKAYNYYKVLPYLVPGGSFFTSAKNRSSQE
jgi:hypothetical protein